MKELLISSILIFTVFNTIEANAASRQAAVNKAIEQTKSRQSQGPAQAPARVPASKNKNSQSPGRNEVIDVEKLNKLLRILDKTWVMPKKGSKEPVGSNFQYKKTCSSIFSARHGACQQLSFGVMCFNYCHEKGEKLSFRCQDASDATYCKQSGTFETYLAKYRKDAYKAKAYVHQMISRCYATAVCNTQTGMLNSTILNEHEEEEEKKTTRVNSLRLLTRPPKGITLPLRNQVTTTTELPTPPPSVGPSVYEPAEEILETTTEEVRVETTTKRVQKMKLKPINSEKKRASPRAKAVTPSPKEQETTAPNIWDKFTVGPKAKATPKYIPFWQKLMTTTLKTPEPEEEEAEIKEETSVEMEVVTPATEISTEAEEEATEEDKSEEPTTVTTTTTTKRPKAKKAKNQPEKKEEEPTTTKPKHTFKPLEVPSPPPQGPELAFQKPGEGNEQGPGFWNRFQPNRWYQSIHYVTNTGK